MRFSALRATRQRWSGQCDLVRKDHLRTSEAVLKHRKPSATCLQQQHPLPEQPPPCVADPCAVYRRASRALTRFYDLVLAPTGLKATQFITLWVIGGHGEIAQWQLSQDYAISVETLSRRLATLRNAGLLNMRIGSSRRGERLYSLTPRGAEKLRNAEPYWSRARQRLAAVIGDEELYAATEIADRIAQAAQVAEAAKMANQVPPHSWCEPSAATQA